MLTSRVAIITGGARGIGLATARQLLKNGARVTLVDVSEEVGQTASRDLQKEFSQKDVLFLPADVTKPEELRQVFERTKKEFGAIDIVCNNAGIGNEENWRKMIDINLVAVIEGTYLGLEYMSDKKGGRGGAIVNVASFGGLVPMISAPGYSASKFGVVGFSRSLTEKAITDSVRVNCICPEFVNTRLVTEGLSKVSDEFKGLVAMKGLLEPEKVAEGILELITDTTKVGHVMTVTVEKGIRYIRLLGDSKL